MIVIYKNSTGQIVAEDRYALGHARPKLDPQNNVKLIDGSRTAAGKYHVTFIRYTNTLDSIRDVKLYPRLANFTFAFGSSDTFAQHSSYVIMNDVLLSTKQICYTNCLTCTGPEPEECSSWQPSTNPQQSGGAMLKPLSWLVAVLAAFICILV